MTVICGDTDCWQHCRHTWSDGVYDRSVGLSMYL